MAYEEHPVALLALARLTVEPIRSLLGDDLAVIAQGHQVCLFMALLGHEILMQDF